MLKKVRDFHRSSTILIMYILIFEMDMVDSSPCRFPRFLSAYSSCFLLLSNSSTCWSKSVSSISVAFVFKISRRSIPKLFCFSSSVNNLESSVMCLACFVRNFYARLPMYGFNPSDQDARTFRGGNGKPWRYPYLWLVPDNVTVPTCFASCFI